VGAALVYLKIPSLEVLNCFQIAIYNHYYNEQHHHHCSPATQLSLIKPFISNAVFNINLTIVCMGHLPMHACEE